MEAGRKVNTLGKKPVGGQPPLEMWQLNVALTVSLHESDSKSLDDILNREILL